MLIQKKGGVGEEGSGKGGREEERDKERRGRIFFFLLSITFFLLNLLICKMPHFKKSYVFK